MSSERLYCDEPDCPFEVAGHGRDKCATHLKQLQRKGKTSPIAEKLNPEERLLKAANLWVESDTDQQYETRRRAVLAAGKAIGQKEAREIIRKAIRAAIARGVRFGRPPKNTEEIKRRFRELRSVVLVAEELGIHRVTVYRHLRACRKKIVFATSAERPRGSE